MKVVAVMIYNAINLFIWCGLAYHTGHWRIALFSCLTIVTYKHEDDKKSE